MASFRKTKNGYEVRIKAKGLTRSKTVSTRQEGRIWAAKAYQDLLLSSSDIQRIPTLLQLIERYEKEVCPRHKGCRQLLSFGEVRPIEEFSPASPLSSIMFVNEVGCDANRLCKSDSHHSKHTFGSNAIEDFTFCRQAHEFVA
jgi:hypothetical protein